MKSLINIYNTNTNTYIGQFFLIDKINKRYNYLDNKNKYLGYTILNENMTLIQVYGLDNNLLLTGRRIGDKIDFLDEKNNKVCYCII